MHHIEELTRQAIKQYCIDKGLSEQESITMQAGILPFDVSASLEEISIIEFEIQSVKDYYEWRRKTLMDWLEGKQ